MESMDGRLESHVKNTFNVPTLNTRGWGQTEKACLLLAVQLVSFLEAYSWLLPIELNLIDLCLIEHGFQTPKNQIAKLL